jgi:hypothetical protein
LAHLVLKNYEICIVEPRQPEFSSNEKLKFFRTKFSTPCKTNFNFLCTDLAKAT